MAERRKNAFKESDIPYSFTYKMRNAMAGYPCPICGSRMGQNVVRDGSLVIATRNRIPTIQHNKPISKGGKHELDNISVICRSCNVSIKANETGKLNNELVKKVWSEINGRR
jgi:5-methylcytosine-specific restriction endonuclease McrA